MAWTSWTRSWCWRVAGSPSAARTPSWSGLEGSTIGYGRPGGARMTQGAGTDLDQALVRAGRYLQRGVVSADLRTLEKTGGREADSFYRDRWSYDKVVRSTHGVNCTGSCSWQVYVKDGIITWEAQQTDYPSAGPDRPDYEPRGCCRSMTGTPTCRSLPRRSSAIRPTCQSPATGGTPPTWCFGAPTFRSPARRTRTG